MKKMLWILLFVSTMCHGQNRDFDDYISKFKTVTVPFVINQKNFIELFPGSIWNPPFSIDEESVKKYIYKDDSSGYRFLASDYGFGYGVKWETDDFHIVILRMKRDHGDNPFNFDRLDLMLVVYDKLGKYIDRKFISKDSESWFSVVCVKEKRDILVQQAMLNLNATSLIDINLVYDASVQIISYKISEMGIIDEKIIDERVGKLVWDSSINNFVLK